MIDYYEDTKVQQPVPYGVSSTIQLLEEQAFR
jgi:hypothetical protein